MLRSSTVLRRRGRGGGRIGVPAGGVQEGPAGGGVPYTRSLQPLSPVSFLYESAPQRPPGPFVIVALCEEIKRGTQKEKGQQKEGVRREKRVVEEEEKEDEGGQGRLGKRVPACTTRYTPCQEF